MKHTTRKSIRVFALIAAIAALLNFLPVGALVTPLFSRASTGPHNFDPPTQEADAFTTRHMNPQNANFTEGKHDSFTLSVSGWEAIDTSANVSTGIINTASSGFDTFKQNNKQLEDLAFLEFSPLTKDNTDTHALIMTNKTNSTARASYHSSDINLSPNSFYEISVDFYAVGSENAIYLIPVDSDHTHDVTDTHSILANQVSFTNNSEIVQSSKSRWQTATFFVHTDMLSSETYKLGLYLGTTRPTPGVVYYDTVRVTEVSSQKFNNDFVRETTQNPLLVKSIDLNEADEKFTVLPKIDFNAPNNKAFTPVTQEKSGTTQARSHAYLSQIPTVSHLNFEERKYLHGNGNTEGDPESEAALLVSAVESNQGIRITNPVNIERQAIYMISYYAIATNYTYMRITDHYIDDEDFDKKFPYKEAYDSDFFDIKRDESKAARNNNWVLNTVFLKGDALYDTKINIEFWVGGDLNATHDVTGYLLIDDFAIARVSNEYFEKHKEGSNSTYKIINENKPENTTPLVNGEFNFGTVRSAAAPFPLKANDWTPKAEDFNKTFSGIVNTELEHWTAQASIVHGKENTLDGNGWIGYGTAVSPGAIPYAGVLGGAQNEVNNVYMMQNKESTWQTLTSAPFTIDRNTINPDTKELEKVYQFSFDAATYLGSGSKINAWAIVEIKGNEIARIDLSRTIKAENDKFNIWKPYTLNIETNPFTSPEITVSFLLGDARTPSAGVLYIDNVAVTSLDKDKVDTIDVSLNDTTKLAHFEEGATVGKSLSFGAKPINDDETQEEADTKAYARYNKQTNVLEIGTNGLYHTKVVNNIPETIESGKYYEYKVNVRVTIQEHGSLSNFDDNGKALDDFDYGVNFFLLGMKEGFFNVKEEWIESLVTYNHKTTYFAEITFLIGAEGFDLALVVEFGSSDVPVHASVGIESTSLNEIQSDSFDREKEKAEDTAHVSVITERLEDEGDDDDDNDDDKTPFNFDFLIIPSIITAVALLFALIATLIRRMKFRTHIERRESTYARDDSVARGKRDIKATSAPDKKTKSKASVQKVNSKTEPEENKASAKSAPEETEADA